MTFLRCGPLDDLVQFAAVKPDTAALRTVIYLHLPAFGHDKIDSGTDGTFHFWYSPFSVATAPNGALLDMLGYRY
jgi:hypothetical protein